MRPFHSYLGCLHCALRCCITPVSMPGHWGSTPCCCQSWTDGRYPDLAIAVTPIDQTQASRQYEARAHVSVFVEWSLRVIRPLADLGPPRQGQARGRRVGMKCASDIHLLYCTAYQERVWKKRSAQKLGPWRNLKRQHPFLELP